MSGRGRKIIAFLLGLHHQAVEKARQAITSSDAKLNRFTLHDAKSIT